MEATICDLSDTRGDDVIVTFHFVDGDDSPLDYSASTFTAQLRTYPDAVDPAVSFDVDPTDLASGVLVLTIPHATAETLGPVYAWDLQQTEDGEISTMLKGTFAFDRDVTR